ADGEALAYAMSIVAGCRAPNYAAIGSEQRLVTERIGVGYAMHLEGDELVGYARGELLLELRLANEVTLTHTSEAVEPGFEGGVVGSHIAAPHAIGLLQPQGFHGAHPNHADTVFLAGLEHGVKQMVCKLNGEVQLPTQRPHEIDTQRMHIDCQSDLDGLAGEPREGSIVEWHVSQL